jgi:cytochrome c biogenesis protein CcmG/thiol:disulfide interchange protein DsbE
MGAFQKVTKTGRARRGLVLAALAVASAGCDRGDHPHLLGQTAPQIALNDGQQQVNLAALRGNVVLLNFWATWCGPCLQELPSLEQMQRDLPQVKVVTISADEDEAAYRDFMARHRVTLLSVREGSTPAHTLYGTTGYPETWVVDKQGTLLRKFVGPQVWTNTDIESYLRKLASQ